MKYFGPKKQTQETMSYKVKSSLYFASLVIAALTYYNVGQADDKDLAMEKEINTIENQTAATIK